MKEVVKLIEKVVSDKQIDRHQGLNAVLDFLIGMFDVDHYLKPEGWIRWLQLWRKVRGLTSLVEYTKKCINRKERLRH